VRFGSSKICSGCGERVTESEREFEVALFERLTFCFHEECYNAWMTFGDGTAEEDTTPRT
jgi:hypothetical protein